MIIFDTISCPLYNLKTVKDFSMKFGTLVRPGLILFVNHDYFYSIEIFFNQKLFCNRRFLRLKLFLFLFDYFSKLLVIVINLTNKL